MGLAKGGRGLKRSTVVEGGESKNYCLKGGRENHESKHKLEKRKTAEERIDLQTLNRT